jgi:hypothetical protein
VVSVGRAASIETKKFHISKVIQEEHALTFKDAFNPSSARASQSSSFFHIFLHPLSSSRPEAAL